MPSTPGSDRRGAGWPDIRASSDRSSSSASRLWSRIASRLARALAGSWSRTCSATPACIAITASPWPTPSCRSCAIRNRSSVAARWTRSSRASRRARSVVPIAPAAAVSAASPSICHTVWCSSTSLLAARTTCPTAISDTAAADHVHHSRGGRSLAITKVASGTVR